jgi:2-keto-3-deoxy-L-rhamnonate aldolase RhmA
MLLHNQVKHTLKAGKPCLGSWIMIGHQASAEILAAAGFDWITVDMEHTSIGYETLPVLLGAIRSRGPQAFVRVEANDPTVIKRVLDCGAGGIIVPLVNSAAEAEAAVRSAKYPPAGFRGVSLGRASDYGANFEHYFRSTNDEVLVVAQIEHYRAVEAIDEILAVQDLDAVFLGPYDLSGSMGIVGQFDHPRMREARRRVLEAGRAAGKAVGFHEVRLEARAVQALLDEGFTMIACGIDTIFLRDSARALVREIGQAAGGGREA